jgi:hypothetical protein
MNAGKSANFFAWEIGWQTPKASLGNRFTFLPAYGAGM